MHYYIFVCVIEFPPHQSCWNNSNMKLCKEVFMPPSVMWPHIPAALFAVFD